MCRMIGVIAREPVLAAPYVEELVRQAREGIESPHADGYGLAIFTDGHWLHVREQCCLWQGALGSLASVRGTAMLLHARKASDPTTINLTKLHPFCWPGTGAGLMFCQNGTIRKHENIPSRLDASAIDTEKYFDLVIQRYETTRDLGQAVLDAASQIEACGGDATSLNCLLSDGRELVAYKGRILPQNEGYHVLCVQEKPGISIVSTEPFAGTARNVWRPLERIYRANLAPSH
jgi:predicted glutamine amidotransferase